MEFKIDTKDSFTIIMPVTDELSANLTDELINKWTEMRQSGSKNFIIDFQACEKVTTSVVNKFIEWHEESYSGESSLVFTGMTRNLINVFKDDEKDLLLNIAPTMKEAIDIVSMEILERDLFSEE